jgi:hypothetical protein
MTIGHYLVIGTFLLTGCRTQPRGIDYSNNSDTTEMLVVEEAWMEYDKSEQVSYVDLFNYGRLKLPGLWKYSDSRFPRYSSYENPEYHLLTLDMGQLDTMTFYAKEMTKAELLAKLYEQGMKSWVKADQKIQTIEQNPDNTISKLVVDATKQIFILSGVKDNKAITLYLVPKQPDEVKNVDLLRKIFMMWQA